METIPSEVLKFQVLLLQQMHTFVTTGKFACLRLMIRISNSIVVHGVSAELTISNSENKLQEITGQRGSLENEPLLICISCEPVISTEL
jgi:hypothetical protein